MEVTLILPEPLPAGTHKLVLAGTAPGPTPPPGGGGQPIPPVGDKTYTFPWGPTFTQDDTIEPDGCLCLAYTSVDDHGKKLPRGQVKLVTLAEFGGIDGPAGFATRRARRLTPPDPVVEYSPEEMDQATKATLERRWQKEEEGKRRK